MTQRNNSLMHRLTGAIGIAAIASLVALPGLAQTTSPEAETAPATEEVTPSAPNTLSSLDQEFVTLAYQGNNAEILTSELALERSQNQAVRQYAEQMIREHTQANQLLTDYANQNNIPVPSDSVDPLNQAIAEQLSQVSDAEFDQAYMGAQANAHLRTIALYQTQIAQGQEQGLKDYAAQLLPNIENHYQMASEMAPNYRAEDSRPGMNMNQPVR
ncbi:MAG: hypothetical protein Kow00121_04630 [Elainellaceae cyanobacterium]